MKLSEAIRKGCETTEYCKYDYHDTSGEKEATCALGAAIKACRDQGCNIVYSMAEEGGLGMIFPCVNEPIPSGLKQHRCTVRLHTEILCDWIASENDAPGRRVKDPRKRVAKMLEKVGL